MSFIIKNISSHPVNVLGTNVNPNTRLDLLTIASGAQIIASLRNGSLYDLFQGRRLAVTALEGFQNIGATQADLDFFSYCGFMQGHLNEDDLKYPFQFTTDGYLQTTATIESVTVEVQTEIEGRVLDGYTAAGVKPVIVAGVDASGNAQNLLVNSDGYLMTSTAISIETSSEVEGRVLDGASAAGIKPVITAGVDSSGNAQNLAVTTDGYVLTASSEAYIERSFITLRSFSNTVADSEPPVAFVDVTPQLGAIEINIGTLVVGGTVSPTQVKFRVWARNSQGSAVTTKIDEFTIPSAILALTAATNPLLPLRYNIQEDQVAITVTFLDGTVPTIVSGTIQVRPIAQSSRDDSMVRRDLISGNQLVKIFGYDTIMDALKVVVMNDLYPPLDEPLVVNATSLGTGTTYYPSTDGIEMSGYDSLSMYLSIVGATTSVAVVTVEAAIGSDWTYIADITKTVIDEATGYTLTAAATSTAGGNLTLNWHRPGLNKTRVRIKVVVSGATTGAVVLNLRRAKLGAG